jgi:hypothetical protein
MVRPYGVLDTVLGVRHCSKPVRLRFTASWHDPDLRYVTLCSGLVRPLWSPGSAAVVSGLRRLLPVSAMRWELCTRRSRMASASVGSPNTANCR